MTASLLPDPPNWSHDGGPRITFFNRLGRFR